MTRGIGGLDRSGGAESSSVHELDTLPHSPGGLSSQTSFESALSGAQSGSGHATSMPTQLNTLGTGGSAMLGETHSSSASPYGGTNHGPAITSGSESGHSPLTEGALQSVGSGLQSVGSGESSTSPYGGTNHGPTTSVLQGEEGGGQSPAKPTGFGRQDGESWASYGDRFDKSLKPISVPLGMAYQVASLGLSGASMNLDQQSNSSAPAAAPEGGQTSGAPDTGGQGSVSNVSPDTGPAETS